ncbi:MAG: formate dehydrogenase accessory sulfurtransferase FdhD [Syntrophomonadaceae bacterium]|nr:formate dehydrogenase accessory sulfurtransferase FdhD [Syntrophomonadaceae bacterium]
MMEDNSLFYQQRTVMAYDAGSFAPREAGLVREVALRLVLNGQPVVTMACTPHALEELAVGYLLSEGILPRDGGQGREGLTVKCQAAGECVVMVEAGGVEPDALRCAAGAVNTCNGKGFGADADLTEHLPAPGGQRFAARDLLELSRRLDETSGTFKLTGGVHSAAVGQGGELLCRYEDIGRHNAVDKALGHAFLRGWDMNDKILVLSGRIASEILIKACRHGVSTVLSRSAPTLKAVELAERLHMTVIGFTRGERFNVYTGAERIDLGD